MADSSLSAGSVVIKGLFHDLTLKRSTVSVVWGPEVTAKIAVEWPK